MPSHEASVSQSGLLQPLRRAGEGSGRLPVPVHQGRAPGQVYRHKLHRLHGTEGMPHQAHALPPHFLRPCAEGQDHHGLVLRFQAAPGHQRPRRDTQLHDYPRQHRRPRAAEGHPLSAGHQGQTLRRPGIYRQGPFRAAVHQRHTARHTRAQQHEEHAHERGRQDPAEKEGRHRDRQRRVKEHRSDRALQASLFQQLHCQHTVRYRRILLLPQKTRCRCRICR